MTITKENIATALDQATEIGAKLLETGFDLEAKGIASETIGIAYFQAGLQFMRKGHTTEEIVEHLRSLAITELNRGKTQN